MAVCKHPQFIWFLGHTLLLACSTRFFLSFLTFGWRFHRLAYKSAFVGSLITYGIVLFKTYSNPRTRGPLNLQFASKLWADENTQYFVLALYWFISEPVAIALVPYFCFSVFHFLSYLATNVIPTFDTSANTPGSNTQGARLCKLTGAWVKQNHEKAMRLVAAIEVLALGSRVFFGVLTFGYILPKTSFTTLMVVVGFLRYRYFTSAFTRQQFSQLALQIDHAVADQRVPPVVRQGWSTAKGLMSTYAGGNAGPVAGPQGQRKSQ